MSGFLPSYLPSVPEKAIKVCQSRDRPQPVLDLNEGMGMTVSVGNLRECPIFDFKFNILSHNTIFGAAGSSVLNAELAVHYNLI